MPDQKIISILLTKIMPNPRQPRRSFREGSIQEMADSLTAIGQETPIKVRPLTPEELKLYAPFEYMVVGGHRRRAGAELAGLEALDCIVLDITPQQARLKAVMDNNQDEMDWWDWDLAIYDLLQDTPKPTQTDLARELGKSLAKVNNASRIVSLLTPKALEIIDQNLGKIPYFPGGLQPLKTPSQIRDFGTSSTNPDTPSGAGKKPPYQLTESILLALVPLEKPASIETAVQIVVDRQMGESQVKDLVAWEDQGNRLEDYTPEKATAVEPPRAPRAARTAKSQEMGLNHEDTKGTKEDKASGVRALEAPRTAKTTSPTLAKGGQGGFSSSPQPALDGTPATPQDHHSRFKLLGHALGSAFHWVGQNSLSLLKSLFGWGKREAVKSIEKSIKHDIKRWVGMAVKATGLFILMAVGLHIFYPGSLSRLIAWFMNVHPPRIQMGLNHEDTKASALRPQAEGQALSLPIPAEKGIGTTKESKADGVEATANSKPEIATSQNEPISSAPHNDGQPRVGQPSAEAASANGSNQSQQNSVNASKANSSAPNKIDPFAKAVGDAAGEAAKKAFNLPF